MMYIPNQSGRSMVEIISMLAIAGVLSIGIAFGFSYAKDKHEANVLLNDARLAYMDTANEHTTTLPTGWKEITSFKPKTSYEMYTAKDEKGETFVLTRNIPQGVCNRLLEVQVTDTLTFFDKFGYILSECLENTDIIFAFAGKAFGSACQTNEDCGASFNGFCDTQYGICRQCDSGTVINESQTECMPTCPQPELSCTYQNYGWCCPADTVCNPKPDLNVPLSEACLPTDGLCSCDFTPPTTSIESNCSCKFTAPTTSIASNCSCKFSAPTTTIQATCAYDFEMFEDGDISFSLTPGYQACPSGQYCYLKYTDTGCGTSAGASHIGTLYGACTDLTLVNQGCPVQTSSTQPFSECTGCGSGQYCYLKYTDTGCASSAAANAGSSGETILYGACTDLTLVNQGCPVQTSSTQPFSNCTGCSEGQYCYLKYKSHSFGNCIDASANHDGKLYGSCLALPSTSSFCPVQ